MLKRICNYTILGKEDKEKQLESLTEIINIYINKGWEVKTQYSATTICETDRCGNNVQYVAHNYSLMIYSTKGEK